LDEGLLNVKAAQSISGQEFREMLGTATNWLEKSASDIDALNVFPVPDGDTGTNMLLTMRSSVEEAFQLGTTTVSSVAQAVAHGALMGARGNSGVILSQIWRGLAQELKGKKVLGGRDLAAALVRASRTAYEGISNPTEGTILTVVKDAAAAAQAAAEETDDPIAVLEAAVTGAGESVANTPNLLPILKQSGVVDAGGQGLLTILDGALRYLRGEAEQMQFRKPQIIASSIAVPARPSRTGVVDEVPFGYCTEFLLKGEELNPDAIRTRLQKKGQSLITVGDETTVRVHIHTLDPGNVVRYATSLGTMHQVSIRNMDEQYQDFLQMQKQRAPEANVATVAIVAGDGLGEVFASLGATGIVPGGQTMNPSTKEILQAVKNVGSDKVIILPNNKNVVLTATQVKKLTDKQVEIVPSCTVPQGVAALLAFDYEADFETSVRLMKEAIGKVRTIEITQAVRPAKLNGLKIKRKQAIGLLDDELLAAGTSPEDVLHKMLAKIRIRDNGIATIYFGQDIEQTQAEQVGESIRVKYPQLQVEVVRGGQPHYSYIVSVE
jgi:DAK2 domain fusion protein YloV